MAPATWRLSQLRNNSRLPPLTNCAGYREVRITFTPGAYLHAQRLPLSSKPVDLMTLVGTSGVTRVELGGF